MYYKCLTWCTPVQPHKSLHIIWLAKESNKKGTVFIAKLNLNQKEPFQIIRAKKPIFKKGVYIGGLYELEDGYYIIKKDISAEKPAFKYALVKVEGYDKKEVASIIDKQGGLEFSANGEEEILKGFFEECEKRTKYPITCALIKFAKYLEGA